MINLIELHQVPIFEQLKLEEALLRTDDRNWCIINHGTTPAIVMGSSAKPEEWVKTSLLSQKPVPLIRRFSSGGTVFVDSHTFFATFICNAAEIDTPPNPPKVLEWVYRLFSPVFANVPFRLVENDFAIENRKCCGNAQYFRKGRWLHHSSFLWDYHPSSMEYLLPPPRTPNYRKGRDHCAFLCKLRDYFPSKSHISEGLIRVLRDQFIVENGKREELADCLLRPHRQTTAIII